MENYTKSRVLIDEPRGFLTYTGTCRHTLGLVVVGPIQVETGIPSMVSSCCILVTLLNCL